MLERYPIPTEETKALLLKIKEVILKYPQHFNMGTFLWEPDCDAEDRFRDYVQNGISTQNFITHKQCKTTGCIAGHALCLSDNPHFEFYTSSALSIKHILFAESGAVTLGITMEQASKLFYPEEWPSEFISGLSDDEEYLTTPELTAARIDYFIEHGK